MCRGDGMGEGYDVYETSVMKSMIFWGYWTGVLVLNKVIGD